MNQAKLTYILKCVLPHVSFVIEDDEDLLKIGYKDQDTHIFQTLNLSLKEWEIACLKGDKQSWVENIIEKVTTTIQQT